ncbi:MAG: sulfatase-like hydrolase/transferase [Planctomycetes bacterium]|nr:sulfatase-like hydrolase/transferase [Planctomycetota bacterium]
MPKRPNILFILSDQQRWDTVSCYGQPLGADLNLTPNLDHMAALGLRFNLAFTMQPVCGPARSCLQTGLYATQTGCINNNVALPLNANTIARQFTVGGYETAYIGKWHLASDKQNEYDIKAIPPERRGGYQDHWLAADILEFTSHGYEGYMYDGQGRRVDFEGYRADATANFVIDYLNQYAARRSDRPFFCFASFIEPHHQNDLDRFVGPIGSKQRFARYTVPGDLVGTTPEPGRRCDWPQHMPDYLGCCSSLDQNVGRIRETLERLGLADDTLVIYTSDHGCHFCTRNKEYKRSCHENSIRVPMIACGPGFTGGRVVDDALVSLIDLPRTVLTAGGIEPHAAMRGRALQEVVNGAPADWPDDVYVQISESQDGRAIRTARWKYGVDNPDRHTIPGPARRFVEQYLYDLNADPHERENRVADPSLAGVRDELAQRLKRRMAETGEPEAAIEPAARV